MAEILDWVSLCLAPGLGLTGFWRLIDRFGTPEKVLAAGSKALQNIPGIQARQVAALSSPEVVLQRGRAELDLLESKGCLAISFVDDRYPPLLRQITDPPPVLFLAGHPDLLQTNCAAVVGSRASTAYGRRTAFSLARSLAASLTITSGLALGIDTEAHSGALAVDGSTIAVLGCGLDVIYPYQNRRLYERIKESGLLISEYCLGTPPDGFRFPARNRIIAGLSLGVIVVEAARKSGSLITAQMALDAGREVFAVPGQVDSFKSEGTHWLLKQGAKLVQSVEDVLEELRVESVPRSPGQTDWQQNPSISLDPGMATLLNSIEPYPQRREALIQNSGFTPSRVSELLFHLELEGYVEILAGDLIRRTERL